MYPLKSLCEAPNEPASDGSRDCAGTKWPQLRTRVGQSDEGRDCVHLSVLDPNINLQYIYYLLVLFENFNYAGHPAFHYSPAIAPIPNAGRCDAPAISASHASERECAVTGRDARREALLASFVLFYRPARSVWQLRACRRPKGLVIV